MCNHVIQSPQVNIPTSQSFLNYVLLSMYVLLRLCIEGPRPLRVAWWRYALVALTDVEANFLVVKAYTLGASITSVMLLDCFTIPCVMLLSRIFLRTRYHALHGWGVALCVLGLAGLVISDVIASNGNSSGTDDGDASGDAGSSLSGDVCCLLGAALYAVSNVAQEVLVKTQDRHEFLGMLGVFGSFFSGVQLLLLERQELVGIDWSPSSVWLLAGFVVSMFAMYSLTSAFMVVADATLFNLSLLTSDLYAVLVGTLLFGAHLNPLYFGAATLVFIGILLYNRHEPVHTQLSSGGALVGGTRIAMPRDDAQAAHATRCAADARDEKGRGFTPLLHDGHAVSDSDGAAVTVAVAENQAADT